MGPVLIDGAVQENQLTDEEYVIHRAKCSQQLDEATAKAWMITAKTLFPRNFAVQLEAYTSQKIVKNPKEAARHFSTLFFDFRNENGLWEEVHCITEALQAGTSNNSQFYRDLFSHLLPDVQHELLLAVAERTQDMLEHCRLMLLLISKLPQAIDTQGKKLIDTLMTAEKHCHYQSPVNCFRKLLVFDLLPTLLSSRTVDVPLKQLHRLILKSIEFYVSWLTGGSTIIQGLEESDLEPNDAWKNLFKMMFAMGRKLSWELSSIFCPEGGNREVMCQNLWIFYRSNPLGNEENPNFKQLVYCTTVLLFESLYEYFVRLDPSCFQPTNQGSKGDGMLLVLVRSFFPSADSSTESSLKYRNKEEMVAAAGRPVTVTGSVSSSTASALLSSFFTAVSCWELLHQTDDLKNAFSKICVQLRTDTWKWLPFFITDGVFIYQGLFADALDSLKTQNEKPISPLPLLLKSAGIYLSLGNHMVAVENILHVMANLPDGGNDPPSIYPLVPHAVNTHCKHPLHFMAMNRAEIIQYCISILIACFKDRAFRSGNMSDLAVGHLIVLLQFDWPNNAGLLEEIIERIRRQGHFSYSLFVSYVVHVDILEEFAFLATDQGGTINMDIFPSAVQLTTQRRMTTRRGDLGAREDFRMAMKRQMGRSIENIRTLIPRFIIQERGLLLQALNN